MPVLSQKGSKVSHFMLRIVGFGGIRVQRAFRKCFAKFSVDVVWRLRSRYTVIVAQYAAKNAHCFGMLNLSISAS